jgi:hypothetical protein
LDISHTNIPISKTALAQKIYNDAAKIGKITDYKPEVNDLII